MAVTLYSGLPRSGKSYRMVYDLVQMKDKYYVVHNIDGLKKEVIGDYGFDWVDYCDKMGMDIEQFFSKEYQVQLSEAVREKYKRDMLVIVDEAHEWFDVHRKPLKMWLSYHGHLRQTVWLVSHKDRNIPAVYRSFIQDEYRAKFSKVIFLPYIFIYQKICAGEGIGFDFRIKKQDIFKLYKSQEGGYKREKPSLALPLAMAGIIAGVWFFISMPERLWSKKDDIKEPSAAVEKMNVQGVANTPNAGNISSDVIYYVGKIGKKIYLKINGEILSHEQTNRYMILEVLDNGVKLHDIKSRDEFFVNREPVNSGGSVAESRPGLPVVENKKDEGRK